MVVSVLFAAASLGLLLPERPAAPGLAVRPSAPARAALCMVDPWAEQSGIDVNSIIGAAVGLLGVGGGGGLIAFTENAGGRNEEADNSQPCVTPGCVANGGVVTCNVCKGTGVDPLSELVAGVRQATGDTASANVVKVEDWGGDSAREVVMYEKLLSNFPPKVTEEVCLVCDGRGVVVCDNCQGTTVQPRFLERYSPDDFMD